MRYVERRLSTRAVATPHARQAPFGFGACCRCAAGYVLKKGLEKGDRTTHELLLKCVIIITAVVPRQLPMQMAVAVNHALMTLLKKGIFCTEPYRRVGGP